MLEDLEFFHLGNVHKNTYEEILTQDKSCKIINSTINDQYICDSCVYKPYCGVCPVCNYSEQGNIIGKIPETSKCKIIMGQFDWVINKILNK
jgi:radical SAM protein with 4Fe4S-binding SPASM domain